MLGAHRIHEMQEGLLRPVGDEEDSFDKMVESFDFDEDSMTNALWSIFGKGPWPLPGQAPVPPRGSLGAHSSKWQCSLSVVPLAVFCVLLGGTMLATRQPRAQPSIFTAVSKVQAKTTAVSTSASPWWQRPWRSTFTVHLHALCSAIIWRQLHRQAILQHVMRCALPSMCLWVIHRMHDYILLELSKDDWLQYLQEMGPHAPTPAEIADSIVEYVFIVTLLYVTVSAMGFFVYHVSAESETGLRKLLHVSGCSRMGYMIATVVIDGIGHTMMGLAVMLAVAGTLLQVRMAVWTSPTVLLLCITSLVAVTVSMAVFFPFFFRSVRTASMAVNGLSVILLVGVPLTPFGAVAPQSLRGLLLPIIPGFRSLFELQAACGKGRCLQLVDIFDAFHRRDWLSMWGMVVSSSEQVENHLTPVGAFLSFSRLVALQFLIAWVAIFVLDMWRYPTLHATGAQSEKAVSSKGVALEVKGLEHRYGWLQKLPMMSETVLSGVSFSLAPGSILGLLGPNGAGKTTTIRCITGEEQPVKGTVAIQAKKGGGPIIGLCPQDTIVNRDLTVRENMLFFAFLRGSNDSFTAGRLVEDFLGAARLKEKEHCFTSTLSGGMLRRLGVCCAMIGTPSVAILDEPTTGLDPVSRRGIWSTINDVKNAGSCCLMTTHMLEEAEALCSYVVILRKGVIAAEGSAQQLKDEWGTGYMLNIDAKPGDEQLARNFVASLLNAENRKPIKVSPQGQMTFKLLVEEEALGHLIIAISKGKETNGIKRWGISQASLEDAYVRIIQDPQDESGAKDADRPEVVSATLADSAEVVSGV